MLPWTRVALEGAVIVGSILLAFAIDAWWDTSREESRELQTLQALRSEFSEVVEEVPSSAAQRARALYAHEALISQMQGAPLVQGDSLLVWLSYLSMPIRFQPPKAEFDDLNSSGGISSTRYSSVRLALARYRTRFDRLGEADDAAWATWEQRIQPFLEGRVPRVERIRGGTFRLQGREIPFGASRFPADLSGVLSDPAFESMLAERWLRLADGANQLERLSAQVDSVVSSLDRALGGR